MEVIRNFPDSELVASIREGKRLDDSIKFIYRNHFDSLGRYITQNSGTSQDAEDVFQEVVVSFIDLVQKNKFRGESSVKTFLYALNRHIWLNELKKRGRALAREEKYEKAQQREEVDISHYIASQEDKQKIMDLLEELGESCRTVLLLFYYENLSMRDILAKTNYENEQVVRNKKYKCLKQLEQMINAKPALRETLKTLLNG